MNYARRFLVKPGSKVKLADHDSSFSDKYKDKKEAQPLFDKQQQEMAELEYRLYAEGQRSVLIVLQAMDAGGKDGAVRHVISVMNPQSCRVTSFKEPSKEDLRHDFLWRIHKAVPGRGEIGIFNRSHYEDVLIVRVHELVAKSVWSKRYDQINDFERTLAESGVRVLKFFLHISKTEQLKRLKARLTDPTRQWKITPADFKERAYWNDYQRALEEAMQRCSTDYAPWFIIPSDKKWFRNLALSQIIVAALKEMNPQFPKPALDLSKIVVK